MKRYEHSQYDSKKDKIMLNNFEVHKCNQKLNINFLIAN